jgi:small conductance mechanosensitive channel
MNADKMIQHAYNWLISHGPGIIAGLVVLVIGQLFIRVIKKLLNKRMEKRGLHSSVQPFLVSLSMTILQVLLIILVMQIIGIQLTVLTVIVGGISVAAGLALSGTLQNFTSGILILLLKPFQVGDYIVAQGQEGTVSSIQIFFTVLITYDQKTVIIPNSKLSNEVIVNMTGDGKKRMDIELKFNYGVDQSLVQDICRKVLAQTDGILTEPASSVDISALEPDGFKVMIHSFTDALEYQEKKFEVLSRLIGDLKAANIKLPGM